MARLGASSTPKKLYQQGKLLCSGCYQGAVASVCSLRYKPCISTLPRTPAQVLQSQDPSPAQLPAPRSGNTTFKNLKGIQESKHHWDLLSNVLAVRASQTGLMLAFKSNLTSLQAHFWHPQT